MGRNEEHAYERRWLILAVLCFSLLIIVLDNSILNVAIPTIIDELGATNSQLQWIIDSYTLVFAGLLLTAGSLGDRYGRRGALQTGFVVFGLGSIASAMATSPEQLIATRALMGIGGALIMPATLSIITNVFPAHERGRAIGAWAGVAGLGAALGLLTGGFLVEHFYWGSVFLVNLPIVVVGLIAGVVLIPTSRDPSKPRLDPLGAVLSITGLVTLLYAIIEVPVDGWTSTVIGCAVAGVVLLGAFIAWELHSDHPMLDVRFFKNPRFTAANGSIVVTFFAMFGAIFLLTQYMQFVLGYKPFEAGIRLVPFAATMMVVAPTSARVVEKIGTKVTVTLGLGLVTLGLLAMATLQVDTGYGNLVWRFMIMAAGMGLVMAPATESVMGSLPLAKAGVGSAVNDTTRQVGGAMGVAIIGSVLSGIYGSAIVSFFQTQAPQAPPEAVSAAKSSLGGAYGVAENLRSLPVPNASQLADNLVSTANQSFVDAMHRGVLVAAVVTLLGAVMTAIYLPAHARRGDADDQAGEYRAEHASDAGAPSDAAHLTPPGVPAPVDPGGPGGVAAPTHAFGEVTLDGDR